MKILLNTLGVGVISLILCASVFAQATSGSQVSGTIQDPGKGVVPGAQVSITQLQTGLTRTAVSGEDGSYTIPNLPVGAYQLKVAKDGFKSFFQSGIILQVNTNPEINVTLEVGQVSEQVNVTASVGSVETHSNGIGQVIDQQRVVELPLNGRVATELMQDDLNGETLAAELLTLLDPQRNKEMRRQLQDVAQSLGEGGASKRAAARVLEFLTEAE